MSQRLAWLLIFVPPVTLKNKHLVLTLSWVQILLCLIGLALLYGAWFQSQWLVLIFPLIVWRYLLNRRLIQQQTKFDLVMNSTGQWRLVGSDNQQVDEAILKDYWVTPVFMAISLVSELGKHHYIILRNKIDAASYSRLNVGIQNNEQTID